MTSPVRVVQPETHTRLRLTPKGSLLVVRTNDPAAPDDTKLIKVDSFAAALKAVKEVVKVEIIHADGSKETVTYRFEDPTDLEADPNKSTGFLMKVEVLKKMVMQKVILHKLQQKLSTTRGKKALAVLLAHPDKQALIAGLRTVAAGLRSYHPQIQ